MQHLASAAAYLASWSCYSHSLLCLHSPPWLFSPRGVLAALIFFLYSCVFQKLISVTLTGINELDPPLDCDSFTSPENPATKGRSRETQTWIPSLENLKGYCRTLQGDRDLLNRGHRRQRTPIIKTRNGRVSPLIPCPVICLDLRHLTRLRSFGSDTDGLSLQPAPGNKGQIRGQIGGCQSLLSRKDKEGNARDWKWEVTTQRAKRTFILLLFCVMIQLLGFWQYD